MKTDDSARNFGDPEFSQKKQCLHVHGPFEKDRDVFPYSPQPRAERCWNHMRSVWNQVQLGIC